MDPSRNEYSFFLNKPHVLIAPLDWGLGHATRCIPLIQHLLQLGCRVTLAGEGAVAALLQEAFPELPILPLPGYRVRYARRGRWLPWVLMAQMPRIFGRIWSEHRWLAKQVKAHKINAVISDNRPGLFHRGVATVYITHQLTVLGGNDFGTWLATAVHRFFIRRFDVCWVPDLAEAPGLAGVLSHPAQAPAGIKPTYLGWLSRLAPTMPERREENHMLVLLSGPEPQRTALESAILNQLEAWPGSALIVRGLPAAASGEPVPVVPFPDRIKVVNHLPARDLSVAVASAGFVWCRSGYTTVMDLVRMQARAVLVPTPGQTEQEYLAKHLHALGFFVMQAQDRLDVSGMVPLLQRLQRPTYTNAFDLHQQVLEEWVAGLPSNR